MRFDPSPSVSSYERGRRLGGLVAFGMRPPAPVSQVAALDRLWHTANGDHNTGESKTARILAAMVLASVRPRQVRSGKSGGWWSNEYPDLVFS